MFPGYRNQESFAIMLWHGPTVLHLRRTDVCPYEPTHLLPVTSSTFNFRIRCRRSSNLIQTGMASRPDFNSAVTVPNNYRELSQFTGQERWLELIEGRILMPCKHGAPDMERWPLLYRHGLCISIQPKERLRKKLCIQSSLAGHSPS